MLAPMPFALLGSLGLLPIGDVYVNLNASNCQTATGTQTDPVCTIGQAIAIAAPGDTIHVQPGSYVEQVIVNKNLTIVPAQQSATMRRPLNGPWQSIITVNQNVSLTMEGFTLRDGNAPSGGAIHVNNGGSLTLRNTTIRDCYSEGGGGVYVRWGQLTMIDCEVLNCSASFYRGGGIKGTGSDVILEGTTVDTCGASSGGGLHVTAGSISGATSSLTLINSTINNCGAGNGGGLLAFGDVVVSGSTISGNSASYAYGAGALGGTVSVENSTIVDNEANWKGGGLALGGNVTCDHITVTGNESGFAGAALVGPVLLSNSVVAQNLGGLAYPGSPNSVDVSNDVLSGGYNLIGIETSAFQNGVNGDLVGTNAAPLDPMLGPLQNNAGPTQTRLPLANSPLQDAANPTSFAAFDQRGVQRPFGFGPDIGATESAGLLADFCHGDGGDQMGCTDCPCANDAPAGTQGGCLNSAATSGLLVLSGSGSLAAGNLRFEGSGIVPSSFAVLTSGASLAPTSAANPCFGLGSGLSTPLLDGLRCAVQNTQRHGGRASAADGTVGMGLTPGWGPPNGPAGGVGTDAGFFAGQVRVFQAFYRELPGTVCGTEVNTTQAAIVLFWV